MQAYPAERNRKKRGVIRVIDIVPKWVTERIVLEYAICRNRLLHITHKRKIVFQPVPGITERLVKRMQPEMQKSNKSYEYMYKKKRKPEVKLFISHSRFVIIYKRMYHKGRCQKSKILTISRNIQSLFWIIAY